jgi:hypothetical protein
MTPLGNGVSQRTNLSYPGGYSLARIAIAALFDRSLRRADDYIAHRSMR